MNHHTQAIVESSSIGANTTVGAFAHILPGARIGRDCRILEHVFIASDVVVGDRVRIHGGARLCDGLTLEDDVAIGPNATFTNDPFPPARERLPEPARTVVRKNASVGANATVLPGITIGQGARIGAGAVIATNVPANAILAGNPARIVGYVGTSDVAPLASPPQETGVHASSVAGVHLHRLPLIEDLRGWLSFGEVQRHVPFDIRRYFLSFGVPNEHIRGEHAHKQLHQFLVCVHGRVHVMADDGRNREEFILDSPALGVHIPPLVWAAEYRYSQDAVLLVLASDYYDAGDYIRDHSEFLSLVLN